VCTQRWVVPIPRQNPRKACHRPGSRGRAAGRNGGRGKVLGREQVGPRAVTDLVVRRDGGDCSFDLPTPKRRAPVGALQPGSSPTLAAGTTATPEATEEATATVTAEAAADPGTPARSGDGTQGAGREVMREGALNSNDYSRPPRYSAPSELRLRPTSWSGCDVDDEAMGTPHPCDDRTSSLDSMECVC
jgi:hypothetical protein